MTTVALMALVILLFGAGLGLTAVAAGLASRLGRSASRRRRSSRY
ncbi:hypothetical protein SAMN05216371_7601 [Streptomyces sp. TLI_053]|nr:hypothetical protein SAMN05216371_7601 [Streptomyces sp. TLI_053]